MNKRNLVMSIISIFCLTSIIFLIIPVHSYTPYTYDPWLDVNDDGKINLIDTFTTDLAFGTSGQPVNKTALLYNVSDTLTSLLAKIDSLNATVIEQQNIINNLNQTVIVLNSTKGLGPPDYDSLWSNLTAGFSAILQHNLGTTKVLVYMIGNYSDYSTPYIHQIQYGGDNSGLSSWGVYWSELTTTTIRITRQGSDTNWNSIRVFIWKIP